jgi:hypothetical protein
MRTSFYSLLCILIRLGTVFLAFAALARIPSTMIAWKQGTTASEIGLSLGVIAIVLLIALALWVYPGVVARLVAGRNSREVFESPIAPAELQWIAFSVLGVYFLFDAVVGLAHYAVQWAMFARAYEGSDDNRMELVSDLSYFAIELIAAIALTLGARGMTTALRRLRYGSAAHAGAAERTENPQAGTTR